MHPPGPTKPRCVSQFLSFTFWWPHVANQSVFELHSWGMATLVTLPSPHSTYKGSYLSMSFETWFHVNKRKHRFSQRFSELRRFTSDHSCFFKTQRTPNFTKNNLELEDPGWWIKMDAANARSAFASQNSQSTCVLAHFWTFRCGKGVRQQR